GHSHQPDRCADLRARLRHRRHRRRRALPDRQRQPQSRPGLHHRFLHGRGVRRGGEPVGDAGRGVFARHRQQIPRTLCGRGARQDPDPGADHPVHPEASARAVRAARPGGRSMTGSPLIRGVYADPILPDFMVFLNWPALPVYWYGFQHFAYAALMVVLVPGLLAFVFGWFAFRSRVTGVYLSIITQALTFALMLGFFRNNFGFGGNNGLTDFKDILGFNVQAPGTRAALFVSSTLALMLGFII